MVTGSPSSSGALSTQLRRALADRLAGEVARERALSVAQAVRAASRALLSASVSDDVNVGEGGARTAVGAAGAQVEAGTFGDTGHGRKSSRSWAGVTKNFPATRAGTSLPLAISVRSKATEIGSLPAKTATASSSRMGSSSAQSAGDGRAMTRSRADTRFTRDRHRLGRDVPGEPSGWSVR
ncbi:conserved hypothetical protein [Ricinus communis]|uniref:Uncharacterized protein n=1 Tax=Ricinus communis TaxID=3988 RepID=B9TGT7_RICCO|nr:conserved hypothetical protein [Ricinus communis]